ncbi:MAG: C39 family peptidase [Clostridia bacterium]|nr:C39 family peptidase [Clostridia bacterium]
MCQQPDPLDKVEHVQKDQGFINVPYINQLEAYPNGCESVSTVMVLKWLGTEITVDEFIDKYLDMGDTPSPSKGIGPDPDKVYCGGPRSDKGWGCNSPVIVNALKKFITTDQYTVEHSYGKSLEELCDDYIDRGIPVIVWVTVGMEDSSDISNYRYWTTPEGKEISYNRRLHCMVLCGYDEENYYFNDPMTQRLKAYTKADSEKAYSILGMQSVVVMQNA